MRVRFGDCTLDTHSRELLREGTPVHLTGKAFRVLEALIENRPNAVSKDDLQDQVWPDVFVSEGNLTSLVTELRNGLGDDARRPTFIRTVYGFGYAFCGEVAEIGSAPATSKRSGLSRYRLVWGRKEIVLTEGENILGRGAGSVEWFDRDTVSRRHARIVIAGETATIEDLGSKNGTYLRGEPVEAASPLADGDQIRLGSVVDTPGRSYDVTPDGRRLLVVKPVEPQTLDKIHLISNWLEVFERSERAVSTP